MQVRACFFIVRSDGCDSERAGSGQHSSEPTKISICISYRDQSGDMVVAVIGCASPVIVGEIICTVEAPYFLLVSSMRLK